MEKNINKFMTMVKDCYKCDEVYYDSKKHQWKYVKRNKVKVVGATVMMCYMMLNKMASEDELKILNQMFS